MLQTAAAPVDQPIEGILPNFLIVGAAKAGSTSLYHYIRQHPAIFMPPPKQKEPSYFVNSRGRLTSFERYLGLFQNGAGKPAIGEASTAYLYDEESPGWIKKVLGDVKIIILLRNPAKRAFSYYKYNVMKGWEDLTSFEQALEKETVRLRDPHFQENCPHFPQAYRYFNSGLYFHQVKRYLDTFGKKRVKVYLFEDLAKDPLSLCKNAFEFLSVDKQFVPEIKVYNESRVPRSIGFQYFLLANKWFLCPWVSAKVSWGITKKLMEFNNRLGKNPRISTETYKTLMRRYQEDISKLEKLIGRDLSVWYADKNRL